MHVIDHRVDGFDRSFARYVIMIREHTRHILQCHIIVIAPLCREYESSEPVKSLMIDNIAHGIGSGQMPVNGCRIIILFFIIVRIIRRLLCLRFIRLVFSRCASHKWHYRAKQ